MSCLRRCSLRMSMVSPSMLTTRGRPPLVLPSTRWPRTTAVDPLKVTARSTYCPAGRQMLGRDGFVAAPLCLGPAVTTSCTSSFQRRTFGAPPSGHLWKVCATVAVEASGVRAAVGPSDRLVVAANPPRVGGVACRSAAKRVLPRRRSGRYQVNGPAPATETPGPHRGASAARRPRAGPRPTG